MVSIQHVIVTKSKVLLLLSGDHELLVSVSQSGVTLEGCGLQLSVSTILSISLSLEVGFLCELAIEVSLEGLGFNHESRMVILGSGEFSNCGLKSLVSLSKFIIFRVGQLREIVSSLLCLVEVIVDALDFGVVVLAFSLLECNSISESVDLILILSLFLS